MTPEQKAAMLTNPLGDFRKTILTTFLHIWMENWPSYLIYHFHVGCLRVVTKEHSFRNPRKPCKLRFLNTSSIEFWGTPILVASVLPKCG